MYEWMDGWMDTTDTLCIQNILTHLSIYPSIYPSIYLCRLNPQAAQELAIALERAGMSGIYLSIHLSI